MLLCVACDMGGCAPCPPVSYYYARQQVLSMQEVVYFSQKCAFSRALVEKLQTRADLLGRLKFVDCTNLVSENGGTFFAVREDGSRHEIPMLVCNFPAIDFIVPKDQKIRRPLIGLERISNYLQLNSGVAEQRPTTVSVSSISSSSSSSGGDGGSSGAPSSSSVPVVVASSAAVSSISTRAFVPSAPAASLARP